MLVFKITLAPILIALVTLAGRKWGPGVAGWLLGFPLNSGPIIFFLLLERGPRFAASAARGSLLGILAWMAFCVTYAFCCNRMSWWWATLAGWLAYFLVAAAFFSVTVGVVWSYVLVIVALLVVLALFPAVPESVEPSGLPREDLWLRMATASLMVLSLTAVAKALGATLSGILTAFPAYTTILAVFTHRHGAGFAARALKGVTAGLFTAATFLMTLSVSLMHLNGTLSFALAIAAALAVQATTLPFVRRTVRLVPG